MKSSKTFLVISLLLLISLACAALNATPADTAPVDSAEIESTNTSQPTNIPATPTKKPTNTPRPTNTAIPPTATAVSIKSPAINGQYEVKILTNRFLDSATTGYTIYTANPGYKFLELTVLVKNQQPDNQQNFKFENVYLIQQDNYIDTPFFIGYFEAKKDEQINPATLNFESYFDTAQTITFQKNLYLRVIWVVIDEKPFTFLFGFDTAPLIEVPVK